MKIAHISVNRPIMMSMLIIVFVLFGGLAYFSLTLNQMPDVEIPYVTISTVYPGAGPKEIETQITKKIEDAVSTVSKIKVIDSYSLEGISISIIQFELDKDIDIANQEVKDKVDAILSQLPDDAELPIIQKVDLQAFPVVNVILSGEQTDPRDLYFYADRVLRDRFSQIEGVANVTITGGQEREIQVKLDNRTVYENNISLPQLIQVLKAHNIDIPAGYFKLQGQEYTVRMQGQYSSPEQIKELQIPTSGGLKKIGQLAEVFDEGKDVRERAVFFDNKAKERLDNVINIGIIKSPEGNVVNVANAIRKSLPQIEKNLPKGMKLDIALDRSEFIKSSVSDALSNIYMGVLLTGLVLLFFLHDIRTTFIVALAMPISIVSTFFLMQVSGFSLNTMTLMGLSVSVGVLVSNSIVVIENIFRHKEELGSDNKEAAAKGTDEVVVAVLAATMTNLVVFLPIAQMTSMVGLFFREFALTVTYATLFSLLVSFTVTPMLASLILPKEIKVGKIGAAIERYWSKVEQFYKRTLAWVLSRKLYASIVAFGSFTLLILSFIVLGPQIGFENFPRIDDSQVRIKVELPDGYNIDETAIVMAEIERRISQYPDVTKIITSLGKQSELDKNTNLAVMDVTVTDANQRETTLQEFITEFTNLLSDIPNAKIKVDFANNVGGPGAPIEFYLMGNDALVLEELKTKVVDEISDVPGLINFDNSSRSGKPEITIFPYREKIEEAGITVMDVAMTLRASMEGLVATTYREKGEEYDIKVKLFDDAYNTPEKVGNIPIATPNGAYRLSQLGEVRFTKGFAKILHRDKLTTIKFTGSPAAGVPLGQVTDEIEKRLAKIEMPAGYYYKWGGSAEMMKETVAEMLRAFLIAIVLTYMLLAALLEDLVQPLIIMSTLPLSFIGVLGILFITGATMNTISMMAIIMLVGIVVNNAILILDYSNQLVRKGMSHRDAMIEAAPTKLKPQIMASAAIILGMLPMALGIGDFGKELRMPLGIVSLGGLLVSTILTIYVIPSADYLNNAFGNAIFGKLKRIFKRQTA